jgi:hypothetical protein
MSIKIKEFLVIESFSINNITYNFNPSLYLELYFSPINNEFFVKNKELFIYSSGISKDELVENFKIDFQNNWKKNVEQNNNKFSSIKEALLSSVTLK